LEDDLGYLVVLHLARLTISGSFQGHFPAIYRRASIEDLPLGRLQQAGKNPSQGGFTAPTLTHQPHSFAGPNAQVYPVHRPYNLGSCPVRPRASRLGRMMKCFFTLRASKSGVDR
jgi:hypothetical protein